MFKTKSIGLVAHDSQKATLLAWADKHKQHLIKHKLYATGTTGALLEHALQLPIHKLESGPLGGDLQLGAKIVNQEIDILIFFWDPLEPQPHDPDVRALLRISVVWNLPLACNEITADIIITSTHMYDDSPRQLPDYHNYRQRNI